MIKLFSVKVSGHVKPNTSELPAFKQPFCLCSVWWNCVYCIGKLDIAHVLRINLFIVFRCIVIFLGTEAEIFHVRFLLLVMCNGKLVVQQIIH